MPVCVQQFTSEWSFLYVFSNSLTILVTRTSCCHPRPDRGSRVMFFCPSIYAAPPGTKNPWIPDKNVGNDREGKTGMTEGDIGKCQRMTEHLQFPTPVPDLIGDLIGDPGFCPHVSSLIRRAEEKDSGSPIRSGMTAGGSPTRGKDGVATNAQKTRDGSTGRAHSLAVCPWNRIG